MGARDQPAGAPIVADSESLRRGPWWREQNLGVLRAFPGPPWALQEHPRSPPPRACWRVPEGFLKLAPAGALATCWARRRGHPDTRRPRASTLSWSGLTAP